MGSVVTFLLECEDVVPYLHGGRKPLSFAACGGDKAVVKLLLPHWVVYPDSPDNHGGKPPIVGYKGG